MTSPGKRKAVPQALGSEAPRPAGHSPDAEAVRRELARACDCFTSVELRAFAGITEATEAAWRKRGCIDYVLFGTQYFYPRAQLTKRLAAMVHEARGTPAKGLL